MYADGSSMTANTEYNQLGPLLEALGKGGDQPDPETGYSPFPVTHHSTQTIPQVVLSALVSC